MKKDVWRRFGAAVVLMALGLLGMAQEAGKEKKDAPEKAYRVKPQVLVAGKDAMIPRFELFEYPSSPFKKLFKKEDHWIVLTLHVNAKGVVEEVVEGGYSPKVKGYDMRDHLAPIIKRWTFKPLGKHGKAMPFTWTIKFLFQETGDGVGLKIFFNPKGEGDPADPGSFSDELEVVMPKATRTVEPKYPEGAKRNPSNGTVRLGGIIDSKGAVHKLFIMEVEPAWNKGFEFEALKAVRFWKHEPGKVNGHPTAFFWRFTIHFKLE